MKFSDFWQLAKIVNEKVHFLRQAWGPALRRLSEAIRALLSFKR